jgi:hypothetical protein
LRPAERKSGRLAPSRVAELVFSTCSESRICLAIGLDNIVGEGRWVEVEGVGDPAELCSGEAGGVGGEVCGDRAGGG